MKRLIKTTVACVVLLLVFILLSSSMRVAAQDSDDNPVSLGPLPRANESGMAPVNDIKMYYAIYGEGEPLILLHGGLGNADYYANQIPVFAQKYKVIAIDSRGHGRSTVTETPIGYDLMMSDVIALMDYLKIESANLVGWSDGGIIGLDMAINHPERLRKLIAYGANYEPSGVRTDLGEDKVFNAFIAQAKKDYQKLAPDPDKFDAFLANINNMWATEPNFTPEQLGKITTPILILDGWEEEAIYSEHAFKMAQLIPGAELHLMPGVGHFAMFKTPEMFNSIVLEYLSR